MPRPTRRDVHVETALSNISVAYGNPNYIAEAAAPRVQVAHVTDKYFKFSPHAWFRDEARVRAPTTRAHPVDWSVTTASYACIEYALSHMLDDGVRENADDPLRPEIEAVEYLTDKLLLSQEVRVANLITASANWANSGSAAAKWSNDTSDPFNDITGSGITAVTQQIGRPPNTLVMSASAWFVLANHPDMLARFSPTVEGGQVTEQRFVNLFRPFGIERLLVGYTIKDTSIEGGTSSRSYIWGNNVWLGYVPPNPGLMQPASAYIFEFGAREVNRYRMDPEHSDYFEARHTVDEVIAGSEAGYVLMSVV